jgi:hypothetical protein
VGNWHQSLTERGAIRLHDDTHSFVIRIWNEARDREGNVLVLRGSIEHVGIGRRRYFNDLDGAIRFIRDEIGVQPDRDSRIRALLSRIRQDHS